MAYFWQWIIDHIQAIAGGATVTIFVWRIVIYLRKKIAPEIQRLRDALGNIENVGHQVDVVGKLIGIDMEMQGFAILWADNKGMLINATAPYLQWTGKTLQEVKDNGWVNIVHPDDLQQVFGAWRNTTELNVAGTGQFRMRQFDGEYEDVEWHSYPTGSGHVILIWRVHHVLESRLTQMDEELKKLADHCQVNRSELQTIKEKYGL